MRPLAPLELWLLAHRPGTGKGPLMRRAPLPFAGAHRPPLTLAERWDNLIDESGLKRIGPVAQSAEQPPRKRQVAGSIPAGASVHAVGGA